MASYSWPSELPQDAFTNLSTRKEDNRLRTQMDAGPPKMRPKGTAGREIVNHSMIMKGSEKKVLDSFWDNELSQGTKRFDWQDPTDDSTVEMRFVEPYQADLIHGGDSDSRRWTITMKLEIMP